MNSVILLSHSWQEWNVASKQMRDDTSDSEILNSFLPFQILQIIDPSISMVSYGYWLLLLWQFSSCFLVKNPSNKKL